MDTPQRTHGLLFYALQDAVLEVYWHEPHLRRADVPEALVQDIWRLQQIDLASATTVSGQPLNVYTPGTLNRDAGPDFVDARVQLDDMRLEGPVEIHTRSGIWYEHRHHDDPAYDEVILHVTLEPDLWTGRLQTRSGRVLPEVVLAPLLKTPVRSLLHAFRTRRETTIACSNLWGSVPAPVREGWILRLGRERLRSKISRLASSYLTVPDLDQLLYELVLMGLGYSKNAQPMLALARLVPLAWLRRLPGTFDVQAALLGTAGLLPEPEALRIADRATLDFVMLLREAYARFRTSHTVEPMQGQTWRYFRLRPSNFPPLRIAQGAALASSECDGLLARDPLGRLIDSMGTERPGRLRSLFRVDAGPFWHTHVRLDRTARRSAPLIGTERIRALLLNAVAPVLLIRAEHLSDVRLEEKVYDLVAKLKPDEDEVTRQYAGLGSSPRNSLEAQGMHELYGSYCTNARCLACDVGRHLIAGMDSTPHTSNVT